MTAFTESHLRRMIEANKGRRVAFHLQGGTIVCGEILAVDTDADGYIEIVLETDEDRTRFVTPVQNILAYEVGEDEENE